MNACSPADTAIDTPYYEPAGQEVALFEHAWRNRLPLLLKVLRPALFKPLRPELFRGETRRMSHAVAGRIFPGSSVGQEVYRARGSLGGKRQASSGS